MLHLKEKPTLEDFQEYVRKLEIERGFSAQSPHEKCLLLGEEIGELFKAIRKATGLNVDENSSFRDIGDELADILIYICSIANRFDISLEESFRKKEKINKQRKWIKIQ
ncbi:MazG nucleotide pyrophosphohydrolase domain-containing protein [Thermodesulfobacteriota bacterium]